MKMNKVVLIATTAIVMGCSSLAQAEDQGHGTVSFEGSIIDSPCSISPDSIDQTVDLGQVSNVVLRNGGKSIPRNFQIGLENCDMDTLKSVTTTFSGMESAVVSGLLGVTGEAQGAGIAITDGSGTVIALGEPTSSQNIQDGNNTLVFSAYLQGASASNAIVPGNFYGVADFTLAYQ